MVQLPFIFAIVNIIFKLKIEYYESKKEIFYGLPSGRSQVL